MVRHLRRNHDGSWSWGTDRGAFRLVSHDGINWSIFRSHHEGYGAQARTEWRLHTRTLYYGEDYTDASVVLAIALTTV
jgi:hypothetical protein